MRGFRLFSPHRVKRGKAVLPGDLFTDRSQLKTVLIKDLRRDRMFFADDTEQKMFGADMAVFQAQTFFISKGQYFLGFG